MFPNTGPSQVSDWYFPLLLSVRGNTVWETTAALSHAMNLIRQQGAQYHFWGSINYPVGAAQSVSIYFSSNFMTRGEHESACLLDHSFSNWETATFEFLENLIDSKRENKFTCTVARVKMMVSIFTRKGALAMEHSRNKHILYTSCLLQTNSAPALPSPFSEQSQMEVGRPEGFLICAMDQYVLFKFVLEIGTLSFDQLSAWSRWTRCKVEME